MGCSRFSERLCLRIQDGEPLRKMPVSPLDLHTRNSTHKCPTCENACTAHNTLKTNAGVFSQAHLLHLLEQNLSQELQGSLSRPDWLTGEPQGSSCLPLQALDCNYRVGYHIWISYFGARDRIWVHVCVASTLLNKPSPWLPPHFLTTELIAIANRMS